jgi:NTE family protein
MARLTSTNLQPHGRDVSRHLRHPVLLHAPNATGFVRRGWYRRRPQRVRHNSAQGHLEELVDFDLINSGQVRLSLGAVDVRKGTSIYFDTKSTRIHSDHVRASGALPPGFPPVTIDGEHYWDGGVVSNTPITYVSDERPLTTARIIQVDVFNSQGELPRNLSQVSERAKDIQYASRTRLNIEQIKEIGELRAAYGRLVTRLPKELRSDPDAIKLAAACDDRSWTIIRLINARRSRSGLVKDYEFSRATITEAWTAGLEDVRRSVSGWDKIRPSAGDGVLVYRPTEALPSPGFVATPKKAKSASKSAG